MRKSEFQGKYFCQNTLNLEIIVAILILNAPYPLCYAFQLPQQL